MIGGETQELDVVRVLELVDGVRVNLSWSDQKAPLAPGSIEKH
jgi:hypothetical protein